MIVVIPRASSLPEVSSVAHLPVTEPPPSAADRATVLVTVCGRSLIGRTFDREGPTCAFCLAMSGQHPGRHGKQYLARWHRSQQPEPVR